MAQASAYHPFAEGESKSRECKNEEMSSLALLAPGSAPAAVSAQAGWAKRREGKHCST